MQPSWASVLSRIVRGEALRDDECQWAFRSILTGNATDSQVGAFAVGLRTRGETSAELVALVREMLEHANRPRSDRLAGLRLVDTCGTGGDRSGTVNISTTAAIVAAAAGATVAKHGNRAASSLSGSADVLETLGLPMDLPPQDSLEVLLEVGITFFFAPAVHPALGNVAAIRKQLGAPTTFNLLGPLANPLSLVGQAIGIPDPNYGQRYAEALLAIGRNRAIVFSSRDGLDELSPAAISDVWEVHPDRSIDHYALDPEALGIVGISLEDLQGGDAEFNAKRLTAALSGEDASLAETAALNAAAALRAASAAPLDWPAALEQARAAIATGAASRKLHEWLQSAQRIRQRAV